MVRKSLVNGMPRNPYMDRDHRTGGIEYHYNKKDDRKLDRPSQKGAEPAEMKPKAKYVPKGIDPAFPQKNFVEATFINKGKFDSKEWLREKYGIQNNLLGGFTFKGYKVPNEPHGYGHRGEARVGYLRLSGSGKAHRLGKR